MKEEQVGSISRRREEMRESLSPEQRSDRKLRPVASRSLWTVRDEKRISDKILLILDYHSQIFIHSSLSRHKSSTDVRTLL